MLAGFGNPIYGLSHWLDRQQSRVANGSFWNEQFLPVPVPASLVPIVRPGQVKDPACVSPGAQTLGHHDLGHLSLVPRAHNFFRG